MRFTSPRDSICRKASRSILSRASEAMIIAIACFSRAHAAVQAQPSPAPEAEITRDASLGRLYIREYRVRGAHRLTQLEIEKAVYPFLGPRRGAEDVEAARVALQKVYQAKGYQTVSVQVPAQQPAHGIVYLQVEEAAIGRLRV